MIPQKIVKLLRAAIYLIEAGLFKEALQVLHRALELLKDKLDGK